ncbi:hypothetical protein Taro_034426 [Colocasia esculenta]|uniref:Uncharacterized protein n=1 Tax=Colocasia esculenta TaxID=4460 RepID=A0A843W2W7_COLES|nr:hypothetical protein [Colocasia esculenta]
MSYLYEATNRAKKLIQMNNKTHMPSGGTSYTDDGRTHCITIFMLRDISSIPNTCIGLTEGARTMTMPLKC